jgi:hypothetical protein
MLLLCVVRVTAVSGSLLRSISAQICRKDKALQLNSAAVREPSTIAAVPAVKFMNGTAATARWFTVSSTLGPELSSHLRAQNSFKMLGKNLQGHHHKTCLAANVFDALPRVFKAEAYMEDGVFIIIEEQFRKQIGFNPVQRSPHHRLYKKWTSKNGLYSLLTEEGV